MKKMVLLTLLAVMLVGCTNNLSNQTEDAEQNQRAFFQKISLYQVNEDGSEQATGLVVVQNWDPPVYVPLRMLISPNQDKVLFNRWENAHIILYVANPDGSDQTVVAEQSVPEGSGELDIWSLEWLDNDHIQYSEGGLFCPKDEPCEGPADFVSKTMKYKVNINSIEKELIE